MDSFFLNAINSLSFLKLPWFIFASCLVLGIETFVLYFFWKEWRLALKISFLANIGSSLIAVPLLLISGAEGSMWVSLISAASAIKDFSGDDSFIYLWGVIFLTLPFFVAFVISVLTEFLIGKALKAPEKEYLLILLLLI